MTRHKSKFTEETMNEMSHEVWHEVWDTFDERFREERFVNVAFVCLRCRKLKTKNIFTWWNEENAKHGNCPVCPDILSPICPDCMKEIKAIITDRVTNSRAI